MIICHKVKFMYMKPNNAGKPMWLLAQTANQKLKQSAQIQDADGMQVVICVIFDTVSGISQL